MRVFRRRALGSDPVPPSGIRRDDLSVLDALREMGVELDQPREVEFFLVLPSSPAAAAAAEDASAEGWAVEVQEPSPEDGSATWDVICQRPDAVLTQDFVRDTRKRFTTLAARHGGDLDGWQA